MSITKYHHAIHNKQIEGDEAFVYALNPSAKNMKPTRMYVDEHQY